MPKHLTKTLLILLLCAAVSSCAQISQPNKLSEEDIQREEQKIYALFFGEGPQTVVILQQTSANFELDSEQSIKYIREGLSEMADETFASYNDRNREAADLSPQMQIGTEYILLDNDELSRIMSQSNGWESFNEKFPNSGYTQFSRVGFNTAMDQAFVYVGRMAGPLMGYGSYYLLEKQAGSWVIKQELMAWIS